MWNTQRMDAYQNAEYLYRSINTRWLTALVSCHYTKDKKKDRHNWQANFVDWFHSNQQVYGALVHRSLSFYVMIGEVINLLDFLNQVRDLGTLYYRLGRYRYFRYCAKLLMTWVTIQELACLVLSVDFTSLCEVNNLSKRVSGLLKEREKASADKVWWR